MMSEPWLRTGRMMELIAPAPGAKVLLVGEAEGLLACRLARERGADVTWLEPAIGGEPAAVPGGKGDWSGIRLMRADHRATPFEPGEFDAVASQFTIEYLEDPAGALVGWQRVLRPRGVLALVTRNSLFGGGDPRPRPRPAGSYSPAKLRRLVEGCGFEVGGLSTLIPDLRFPRLYRGDLSFSYRFERLPYFRDRGLLLFVSAVKGPGRKAIGGQDRP